ncbi:hypothetical protein [Asticcacaulis sp. AC402]|uniref:hypothetical protein n=1 Tax=Asticcacaulis sp. AC402 TaxID=1282361 RepID=UPI0003C3AF3E|nr:hypothetical protein [Asticcacaulis sp. AC402]ESQ74250.1 hypothetical protein ABAC402_14890 [Asticcacaulis sp. AC402]
MSFRVSAGHSARFAIRPPPASTPLLPNRDLPQAKFPEPSDMVLFQDIETGFR